MMQKEAALIVTRSFQVVLESQGTTAALLIGINGQRDLQINIEEMPIE